VLERVRRPRKKSSKAEGVIAIVSLKGRVTVIPGKRMKSGTGWSKNRRQGPNGKKYVIDGAKKVQRYWKK